MFTDILLWNCVLNAGSLLELLAMKLQTNIFRDVTKASAYENTHAETTEDEGAKSNISNKEFRLKVILYEVSFPIFLLEVCFGSFHPGFHFVHENNPFPIRTFRSAHKWNETAHKPFEGLF